MRSHHTKGISSKCQATDPEKEYEELGTWALAISLCNSEYILFCLYGSFLQTGKSTWMTLEITFAMLAIITAAINENHDSTFL